MLIKTNKNYHQIR